jgi:hypothetical protein
VHRRLCDSDRLLSVLDLGATLPCEKSADEPDLPEPTFPLRLRLCEDCLLLQIPALITRQSSDSSVACLTCTIVWPKFARTVIRGSALPGAGHRNAASWRTPHARTGWLARTLLPARKRWFRARQTATGVSGKRLGLQPKIVGGLNGAGSDAGR